MHLKELILEGFKSYSQKTVIKPFDSRFNAITGLNGSGKSNILDALIFLLGITGYRDLRASDSKDLIYKQGSAGITQATVTGIFDNTDPTQSPNGYSTKTCPTITVSRCILNTGQSKYTINGTKATQTQVQEMFQSVQLNVLNPHFIIMQGRIAKVCNMKESDLLKLIEEATGTTMYDTKRDAALKNIEKREIMLNQSQSLLLIVKKRMDELEVEVAKYEEFRQLDPMIKLLNRQYIALQYLEIKRTIDKIVSDKSRFDDESQRLERTIEQDHIDLQTYQQQRVEIENEIVKSVAGKTAQEHLNKCIKQESLCKAELDQVRKEKVVIEKKESDLTKIITQLDESLIKYDVDAENIRKELLQAQTAEEECRVDIDTFSDSIAGLSVSGSSGGSAGTFNDRLAQEQRTKLDLDTKIHLVNQEIKSYQRSVTETESTQIQEKRTYEQTEQDIERLKQNKLQVENDIIHSTALLVVRASNALANKPSNTESVSDHELTQNKTIPLDQLMLILRDQQPRVRTKIAQLQDSARDLQNKATSGLNQPQWYGVQRNLNIMSAIRKDGINTSLIHGLIVNLFTLRHNYHNNNRLGGNDVALALEVVGGAKLFNICVSTYETGTKLLQNNKDAPVPINVLPLDKVQLPPEWMQRKVIEIKTRYQGQEGIELASELIVPKNNAPDGFKRIIDHIFSTTFVCSDSIIAKEISSMGVRAVTLQGDSYDPSGVISGGSTNGMNWLSALFDGGRWAEESNRFMASADEYTRLDQAINDLNTPHNRLQGINYELTRKIEQLKRSPYQRSIETIDTYKKDIITKQTELDELQTKLERTIQQIQHFQDLIKKSTQSSDSEKNRKELQNQLAERRKQLTKLTTHTRDIRTKHEDIIHQIKETKEEIDEYKSQLADVKRSTNEITNKIQHLNRAYATARDDLMDARDQFDRAMSKDNESKDKLDRLDKAIQQHQQSTLLKKRDMEEFRKQSQLKEKELTQYETELKTVLKAHAWIKQDASTFGVAGSAYDFGDNTAEEIQRKLIKAQDKQAALKRYNNPLCIEQYQTLSKEYQDKHSKLANIQGERDAIEKSIRMLDRKKIETVENTFNVVDKYFGSIFSILLPGARSRLKPKREKSDTGIIINGVDGKEIKLSGKLIGCEMQVSFSGSDWDQSTLSSLSGGQRTLLALSLILALLRCKPAPLYILDEVDAALDASHTQNIGKTIKDHFKQSQFIIVSLKEGMFENANVLIRTQLGPNGSQLTVTKRAQHD